MNRRRNPERLPPHLHARSWLRALAFAAMWAALILADGITKAFADLPAFPTFRLTPPAGESVPIREFHLFCVTGLNNTGASSTFASIATLPGSSLVHALAVRKLADGPWTCYMDAVTDEPTPRWRPTNRVSFTLAAPPLPIPQYRLDVQ